VLLSPTVSGIIAPAQREIQHWFLNVSLDIGDKPGTLRKETTG